MPQYLPLEYGLLKICKIKAFIETNFKPCCKILVQLNILSYWHKKQIGTEQWNFSNSPHRIMKSKPKEKNDK